ncbi:hypothetical protein [Streptomyces mirabilis]
MTVTELYIADEIRCRLSEETLAEVAAHLHKRDYQTCGKPLGDKAPALSVDDAGPFLSAMLNHQSCRPSGWYHLRSVAAGQRTRNKQDAAAQPSKQERPLHEQVARR